MIQKKLIAIENISFDELVEVIVEKVLNGLEERKNKLYSFFGNCKLWFPSQFYRS